LLLDYIPNAHSSIREDFREITVLISKEFKLLLYIHPILHPSHALLV
jgi:hypothetical protein